MGAAFLGFTVDRGSRHTFSVFFVSLLAEFGWSRAATAGAYSLYQLVLSLASPLAGACAQRLGIRTTLTAGAVLAAAGLFLMGRLSARWELYLYLGIVFGVGSALISTTPLVTLLSEWFREHRGLAHGFAFAGGGLGISIFVPLAQLSVGQFGWRASYRALALVVLVVVLSTAFFLLPRLAPRARSAAVPAAVPPVGEGAGVTTPGAATRSEGWTLGAALRTVHFWALFANRFFTPFALLTVFAHQVAHAVDVGFDPLFAAGAFGLAGLIGAFGMLLWGVASDWMGRERAITISYVVIIAATFFLLWARDPSESWKLYAYAILLGLGLGGRGVIFSALAADFFAGPQFGLIFGTLNIALGLGGALGPWLGGFLHDLTGSYTLTFWLCIFFMVVSCACIWVAAVARGTRRPRNRPSRETQ
ncbi:MAG: MFS transporter [Nitrospinota bacterium]